MSNACDDDVYEEVAQEMFSYAMEEWDNFLESKFDMSLSDLGYSSY